jgi:hypothetical protein
MKKSILLWLLAIAITFTAAVFQRVTGPTYPLTGTAEIGKTSIDYSFNRSHSTSSDCDVILQASDSSISGLLFWRRINSSDDWHIIPMDRNKNTMSASLPRQQAAGKLNYYVKLASRESELFLPENKSVVIRFKGDVPTFVLILHVIGMFGAMLLSTRTGLEFFNQEPNFIKLTYWTLGFLFVGGLILGPVVQKYAFDAYWTGFPFGHDLTDNKTAVAFIGWLIAFYMYRKSKRPVKWALFASILLMIIYLIPHSLLGSELDYNKIENQNKKIKELVKE